MSRESHWVFAYGSNMHLGDLSRWLEEKGLGDRSAGPSRIVPSRLSDWGLVWNYRSPSRRGAAANVEPRPGDEVRGLALEVNASLLTAIDHKEGHPHRYSRGANTKAVTALADRTSLCAWVYEVTQGWRRRAPVRPRRRYLDLMIEAATEHNLGDDWVERLRRVQTEA